MVLNLIQNMASGTHPAEETFKMLAGEVYWQRGDVLLQLFTSPGGESYHPSMLPHATKTADKAFSICPFMFGAGTFPKDGYHYQGG